MLDNLDDGIDLGRWHDCDSVASFTDALMYKKLDNMVMMAIHNGEVPKAFAFHYHVGEYEGCRAFRFWVDVNQLHFVPTDDYGNLLETYPDPVIEMINDFAKVYRMDLL